MYLPPCSPSSSIFSEMLELNATRNSSKPEYLEDEVSVESFNAAKSSPVFFGRYGQKLSESVCDTPHGDDGTFTRSSMFPEFDSSTSHPATYGYVLLDKKPPLRKVLETPPLPDPKECSPTEYLEAYVFPVLLPAIEQMLLSAKENRVFERRRTRFNACDFLTEFLYRYNPQHKGRSNIVLQDIPFVQRILAENPRPPLPLSLLLSDEEAAIIIQSFYRGYLVRRQPEVQELREYQREMRNEAVDIFLKVEDFWKKHPVEDVDEEKSGGTGRDNSFRV